MAYFSKKPLRGFSLKIFWTLTEVFYTGSRVDSSWVQENSSFGFLNKKVEEIKEKTDLIPDILKKPLEDKLQEYSEEPLGKVKINLKKLWNKGVTDEWFDLKAPEGGRIHCLIDLKKPVSVEELEDGKEKKKVFQVFFLFFFFI